MRIAVHCLSSCLRFRPWYKIRYRAAGIVSYMLRHVKEQTKVAREGNALGSDWLAPVFI